MSRPAKNLILLLALSLLSACGSVPEGSKDSQNESKLGFELSRLNNDGLQGPSDGLRALHYEFCIPSDSTLADEVRSIDSTLQVFSSPKGRIQCGENEYLCLGHTHQEQFRSVLLRLAELPYVRRIEESLFEQ